MRHRRPEHWARTHISASASIESVTERGMNAVRRLDVIVRNKFRDDPATLAVWESARRVERASRGRERSKDPAPNSTPEGGQKD